MGIIVTRFSFLPSSPPRFTMYSNSSYFAHDHPSYSEDCSLLDLFPVYLCSIRFENNLVIVCFTEAPSPIDISTLEDISLHDDEESEDPESKKKQNSTTSKMSILAR